MIASDGLASRTGSAITGKSVFIAAAFGTAAVLAALLVLQTNPNTTLTCVAALILAGLTALNLHFGKTLLYPPAMFCALWTVLLTALSLSGNYFYPVSWQTLSFYILGAAAFSLGGSMNRSVARIRLAPIPPTPRDRSGWIEGILTLGLVVLLAGIPFYWSYAQELASTSSLSKVSPMWALRDALIQSGQQPGVKPFSQFIFDSLTTYSILVVFIGCLEDRVTLFQRCRYYALIGVALLFNLGTAGRVGALFEVVGLVALASIRRGGINFKLIGGGAFTFLLAFAPAAIWMNKGGDVTWSAWDNIVGISQSLLDYSLAGVVAFDRIVQNPDAIPPVWRISRSFLQIASRLGFDIYVPSIHAEFSAIRPGMDGNAYTMYFGYLPDFGWVGTLLLVFCLGIAVTYVYRRAVGGDRIHAMLFGIFACCIALSGFSENFFVQLSFIVKGVAVAWICYSMPLSWVDRRSGSPWRGATKQMGERLPGVPVRTRMGSG